MCIQIESKVGGWAGTKERGLLLDFNIGTDEVLKSIFLGMPPLGFIFPPP